jgi:SAM-dependent methyltransferase
MIRLYDRTMRGSHQRRYYANSGYFNFGYWGGGAVSQEQASEALVDQLVARIADRSGRVLDVACGLGASTKRLAQSWPPEAITGINISPAQIAAASARSPGCTFLVMDATKLDFPDNHFAAVICVEAAFHFETREKFLKEAYRVLKPGGSLVMSDILFRAIPKVISELNWVPPANLVSSVADYGARLAATGFNDIDVMDATDSCLGGFRRNLVRWPAAERRAGRMKLSRSLGAALAFRVMASYFGLICRSYLLVSARKPS